MCQPQKTLGLPLREEVGPVRAKPICVGQEAKVLEHRDRVASAPSQSSKVFG